MAEASERHQRPLIAWLGGLLLLGALCNGYLSVKAMSALRMRLAPAPEPTSGRVIPDTYVPRGAHAKRVLLGYMTQQMAADEAKAHVGIVGSFWVAIGAGILFAWGLDLKPTMSLKGKLRVWKVGR